MRHSSSVIGLRYAIIGVVLVDSDLVGLHRRPLVRERLPRRQCDPDRLVDRLDRLRLFVAKFGIVYQ